MSKGRVLVVDDKENMLNLLQRILEKDFQVQPARDGREALAHLAAGSFDVVLSDIRMPGPDGFEVLAHVKQVAPDTEVILMTAHGSIANAVEAIKRGAYDYLEKPFDPDEAALKVARALEHKRLKEETASLRRQLAGARRFDDLIGQAPKLRALYDVIERASAVDLTVLITGETGTGKELVARAVHRRSPRKERPFVAVNCGALPGDLIESELFGHARGAFSGAATAHAGLFEEANGGTLFLDEIGDLPLPLQVKLNRALQDKEVRRVGEAHARAVDVRVIAATLRDLKLEVAEGRFREDLYYRLNVLTLRLPPLRERKEDIPLLVAHFLERITARMGRPAPALAPEVLQALLSWDWPGNVRELENTLERAVALSSGDVVARDALPEELRDARTGARGLGEQLAQLPFREAMELARDRAAHDYLEALMKEFEGNVTRAA